MAIQRGKEATRASPAPPDWLCGRAAERGIGQCRVRAGTIAKAAKKKAEKAQAAGAGETSPSRQGKWTPAEDEQLAAALQQMATASAPLTPPVIAPPSPPPSSSRLIQRNRTTQVLTLDDSFCGDRALYSDFVHRTDGSAIDGPAGYPLQNSRCAAARPAEAIPASKACGSVWEVEWRPPALPDRAAASDPDVPAASAVGATVPSRGPVGLK